MFNDANVAFIRIRFHEIVTLVLSEKYTFTFNQRLVAAQTLQQVAYALA